MEQLRRRWWRLTQDEDGLGLTELMIAMFVMAVTLTALASVVLSSIVSLRVSRDREQATNAGSAVLEQVRARDYQDVAHAGDTDLDTLPQDVQDELGVTSSTCVGGEQLVRDEAVDDAVTDPVELHRVMGNQNRVDVYSVVTFEDAACDGSSSDLKRVVTLARWDDAGDVRWTRQETLVVRAGRGLPVPNFRVRPEEARLGMSSDEADASGFRKCVEHQVRNLGADDTYEWELTDTDKSGAPFKPSGENRWETPNGHWKVTGYLDVPAVESRGGAVPPEDFRMKDLSNNTRLASSETVESGQTATLTLCYEANGRDVDPFTIEITVYSRFDDRRTERIEHQVRVTDDPTDLFLLDWDDSQAHARCQASGCKPNRMTDDVDPDADESFQRIGTADYDDPSASNWSTEVVSSEILPGVRLIRGSMGTFSATADWRYQFSVATTLRTLPQPTVEIWVAPPSALQTGAFPEDGIPMHLVVRLDGLRQNESTNNLAWNGVATSHTYTHTEQVSSTATGWQRRVIPIPITGTVAFSENQFLRLRIACHTESEEDCNLAYDNTQYQSRLQARLVE